MELLAAKDKNGIPGLWWAFKEGHVGTIIAYEECLEQFPDLKSAQLTELIVAAKNGYTSGLYAMQNGLTNLTSLGISTNSFSDKDAAELAKLTNLTSLNIVRNRLDDQSAAEIAKLTMLKSLNIGEEQAGRARSSKNRKITNLKIWDM